MSKRTFLIGYVMGHTDNTIAVVASPEIGIRKIKEWNPTAIVTNILIDEDCSSDDLIGTKETLLLMKSSDDKLIRWWITSIKIYEQ